MDTISAARPPTAPWGRARDTSTFGGGGAVGKDAWLMSVRTAALLVLVAFVSAQAGNPSPACAVAAAGDGVVRGTVAEGGDAAPAADALVRLIPRRDRHAEFVAPHRDRFVAPAASGNTDADGSFALEGVAPGRYVLVAGCATRGMGVQAVTVEAGGVAEVSISLGEGVVLRDPEPRVPPPVEREPAADMPDDDDDIDDEDEDRDRRRARRDRASSGDDEDGDTLGLPGLRSRRPDLDRGFDDDRDYDDDRDRDGDRDFDDDDEADDDDDYDDDRFDREALRRRLREDALRDATGRGGDRAGPSGRSRRDREVTGGDDVDGGGDLRDDGYYDRGPRVRPPFDEPDSGPDFRDGDGGGGSPIGPSRGSVQRPSARPQAPRRQPPVRRVIPPRRVSPSK
jgi:hypothetical protein